MRFENRELAGDMVIAEDLIVTGSISGDARVESGGRLLLRGTIRGDLTIEAGGFVDLRGMVLWDVHNVGGELRVLGTIGGRMDDRSGNTAVDPGARILNRVR
jgi:cytoskeletal protein CcmA (bactofilin family)